MTVQQIDKETLKKRLDEKGIVIIDVRANWASSRRKIPGAVHETPDDVSEWAGRYDPNQPVVVYCATPQEAESRSVAAALAAEGFADVSVLSGGWWVWKTSDFPTEKREKDPLPKGVVPGVGRP